MKSNNDEIVSNVGIVGNGEAVEAYAKAIDVSVEEAHLAMRKMYPPTLSQASQTVPNNQLLISSITVLEGQEAIETYAKDSGKSISEVQALVDASQLPVPDSSGTTLLNVPAFGYYHGELACRHPETGRVFFNVGKGIISLSFIGNFALVGGGTTDRANTFWTCTQDICSLYGFVQLNALGDYTNYYDIFNVVNTIKVVTDDCSGVIQA